jgi:hypothetical protein
LGLFQRCSETPVRFPAVTLRQVMLDIPIFMNGTPLMNKFLAKPIL